MRRTEPFRILGFPVFASFWIRRDRRFVRVLQAVDRLEARIANPGRRFVPPGF